MNLDEALFEYAEQMSSDEPELLRRLNRDTHLHVMHPRMLSGHIQGAFLSMLSHMIRPKRILEIGTYTGYSAICMHGGLQEGGEIITIEHDPELREMAEAYFSEAGIAASIRLINGEAEEVIASLEGEFDLCFLDADKRDYPKLYPLLMQRTRIGGYIIADNVLWSGKILKPPASGDRDTRGLQEFNLMVKKDQRADNLLLPFDDGLMMIRKIA
jgi:predicted O-methyltransferase YrrM